MNETRCPNCRAVYPGGNQPCRYCGWLPLQTTELQFLDSRTITCPHCSSKRPATSEDCPRCGKPCSLDPLASRVGSFHISSLFLLTTLIAICFALMRVHVALGIAASVVASLAVLRTWLLVRERKRHRYPVHVGNLAEWFGTSLAGITLAVVVFGLTAVGIQFTVGLLCMAISIQDQFAGLFLAIVMIVLATFCAVSVILRRYQQGQMLTKGLLTVWIGQLLIALPIVAGLPPYLAGTLACILWAFVILVATAIACRRGGAAQTKAFLVGSTVGACSSAALGYLLTSGWLREYAAASFFAPGILLWPVLLTIGILQNMWSWDDAFPTVASHTGSPFPRQEPAEDSVIEILDDEEPTASKESADASHC